MNVVDLLLYEREKVNWDDVILENENKAALQQMLKEYQYQDELKKYHLTVNHKIILHGESGCGKTMTAKAIANQLNKPLLVLDLSSFVSARIGETAKNIKMIFDKAEQDKAVLFLDEIDHLGKMRTNDDHDVGEMRRLVNTLLQLIDHFSDRGLLIAATNHIDILDTALLRRFQLKIAYKRPKQEVLDHYYDQILKPFPIDTQQITRRYDISFAEAKDDALTQVKHQLIQKLENEKSTQ